LKLVIRQYCRWWALKETCLHFFHSFTLSPSGLFLNLLCQYGFYHFQSWGQHSSKALFPHGVYLTNCHLWILTILWKWWNCTNFGHLSVSHWLVAMFIYLPTWSLLNFHNSLICDKQTLVCEHLVSFSTSSDKGILLLWCFCF